MIQQVNIVLKVDKEQKKKFYDLCHGFNMTPMRTMLILMDRFSDGKLDAMPILQEYKEFKASETDRKSQRLLRYRIDGNQAYKINKKNKVLTSGLTSDKI